MSEGVHPMRDGAEAPALWAPEWDGVEKMGARFVLVMLWHWADGRGALNATMDEMAARLRIGVSSLRDYFGILIREGFVTRPAQGRMADGKMSPLCHWLNLEKLGNAANHRQNSAPVETGAGAVGKPVDEPPPELSAGDETGAEFRPAGAEFQQPPPELGGGENGGVITTGAREGASARAEFPLPSSSYFLSFPWRDEATKNKAGRILEACGPQLGQLGAQNNRVLLSLAYVLDGLWDGFDFERDVLPVVHRKTGPGRKTPLWDFALLIENLETHRAKRLRDEARVAKGGASSQAPAVAAKRSASKGFGTFRGSGLPDAQKRENGIKSLRGIISLIDDGHEPTMLLPRDERGLNGEWLADAFARLRARTVADLEKLEAEGAGNGEA